QEAAKNQLKLVGKDEMRDIDVYKARTDRVKALADLIPDDPQLLHDLLEELDNGTIGETLRPILVANLKHLNEQSGGEPDGGAESAPIPDSDVHHNLFLANPGRVGRGIRLGPLVRETPSGA